MPRLGYKPTRLSFGSITLMCGHLVVSSLCKSDMGSSPYHSNVFVSVIDVYGGAAEAWVVSDGPTIEPFHPIITELLQELDLIEFNFHDLASWVCASVCFELLGMAFEQSVDKITNVLENFDLSAKKLGGICLEEDDVSRSKNTCKKSLFGRIVGDKMANFVGVKNFVNHVWGFPRELAVVELRANLFQFIFGSVEDKIRVLNSRPRILDNQLLILKE
ncbi:hypothetical protein ACH5RR_040579 [Cinchona calisaya]|uniref:DUF4283 domain-containing protein n=1 Tax=Cinchona calisaya TaxID=153742 RepID=A0ABD2XS10_9GENT